GSMAFKNFTIVGTVLFGSTPLDRGAIVVDISDAQEALAMEDAAAELLGYFENENYDHQRAAAVTSDFNTKYAADTDEFAPVMQTLKDQNEMGSMIDISENMRLILLSLFIFAMSIVLWNTGLIGGLRRYGEFGVRLAMGEEKGHIYRSLLWEGLLIGIIGSVLGTIIGLIPSYLLQEYGLDISEFTKGTNSGSMMLPSVIRANIDPALFYIGFIPGVFSMLLGTALAGIGIYRRQTARLFKELEV
ncbi:MAG: ABC transporter permease, partial [Saprospiraceae bacterium]